MANYKELFEQQKLLNETNEKKIHELETKQRIIESSFQNLRQLKQEFSHINQEAQFNNENIHSFLSSFLPDYRCIKEPPREPSPNVIALQENNNNNYKPQVQIDFKIENGDGSTVASQKLPTPTISYEWSDSSPSNEFSPSYLPRMGYSSYLGKSRYSNSNIKPNEELKLTLKFETISSDLPAKLHLELCDQSGNVVFKKRQNIYYVKLQEKLCTLDSDSDYILRITSIQDDIKTDEEVIIQNKQACDGKIQVAKPVKPNVKEVIIHQEKIEVLPKILCKEVTFSIEPQIEDQSYTCCICEEPKHDLLKAKRVRKPVVLFNKDEPKQTISKTVIFEQKKILPDMALYRWHRGFRNFSGRYTRVTVMKLEMYYPDYLHDIRVTRDLSLVLTASTETKQQNTNIEAAPSRLLAQPKNWVVPGKVRDHKCFVDFVIFEDLLEDYQFSIKATPCFDASDLQDFAFNIGKLEINKWKQHEFNDNK